MQDCGHAQESWNAHGASSSLNRWNPARWVVVVFGLPNGRRISLTLPVPNNAWMSAQTAFAFFEISPAEIIPF